MFNIKKIYVIIGSFSLILALLGFFVFQKYTNLNPESSSNKPTTQAVLGVKSLKSHDNKFFQEKLFFQGAEIAKSSLSNTKNPNLSPMKGGIVPHHVFPSFILSDYFARLQIQKPSRIVVIGPNHPNLGKNWALTSKQSWDTPFGKLEPDIEYINQLTQDNSNYKTQIDESVLAEEHSIGGIAPYIKYYIPEAKITPIILKSTSTKDQINYMSDLVAKIAIDKDTVVIASVDFSHYLTASQARTKDVTTLKAMQAYDIDKILTLNNDYLDSPPSIATMLEIMQKLQTTNQELLNHTNSGDLERDFTGQTTSYFSIGFR